MGSIVTEIEVERKADEVFAYVTDPNHFPEWQSNVTGGHLEGGEPVVGALCMTRRKIGGRERDVTSRLTVFDPPRAWAVHGDEGPIRSRVHVTVEPVAGRDASKVRIGLDFEGHGIGKLLVPLMVVPQSRREMRANMARLKANLEG
ncbi:SRPBCC family protein [Kribbella sp. NPDC026611]|uniref:SRPBCC family protein n=1 Tax=Kribbella sp. NPDC026611 TaxID=3154911 RepID=UPI0033F85065